MDLFHIIDNGAVMLRHKGVYRQVDCYHRGREVFAPWGAKGFIKLCSHGGTTVPGVSWDGVEAAGVSIPRAGAAPVFDPDRPFLKAA